MPAEPQHYIIKFKKGVSDADVEKFYKEVAQQGGEVSSKDHQSKLLPRATAKLPDSFAQSLQGHDIVEYIEPDQQVSVNPIPGTSE